MKILALVLLMPVAVMAACAPWPPESAALDAIAQTQAPPPLLPQDQLTTSPGGQVEAAGAALAARAAALRAAAAAL